MKSLFALVLVLFATSASANVVQTGCNPEKPKQAKSVTAYEGDTVIVVAPGNPSTGYGWTSPDRIPFTFTDMSGGAVGGGGLFNFTFQAEKFYDGKTLRFYYKRAWDPEAISACAIKMNIR